LNSFYFPRFQTTPSKTSSETPNHKKNRSTGELNMAANQRYRKPLPGTDLEYYDARAACEDIQAGSYDKLPYTSRILAENLVNRADKVPVSDVWNSGSVVRFPTK